MHQSECICWAHSPSRRSWQRSSRFNGRALVIRGGVCAQLQPRGLCYEASEACQTDGESQERTRDYVGGGFSFSGRKEDREQAYADAVARGLVSRRNVIERTLFLRLILLASGKYRASVKNKTSSRTSDIFGIKLSEIDFEKLGMIIEAYRYFNARGSELNRKRIVEIIGQVQAVLIATELEGQGAELGEVILQIQNLWPDIVEYGLERRADQAKAGSNAAEGPVIGRQSPTIWMRSARFCDDVRRFLKSIIGSSQVSDGAAADPPSALSVNSVDETN